MSDAPPPPPSGTPTATDPPLPPAPAPEAAPAPPAPTAARKRRTLILAIGIPVAVVVLLLAGLGIAFAVQTAAHAPDKAVTAFLDDLVAGEAEHAAGQLENNPHSLLIDDEIYAAAEDRITGYTIGESTTAGATAKVVVEFTTDSRSWSETLPLVATGRDLIWNVWAVDGTGLPEVDVAWYAPEGYALAVNGVALPASVTGKQHLPALPGSYEFAAAAPNEALASESGSASVSGFAASAATGVSLPVTLSETGVVKAKDALKKFLNGCVKQHVLSPKGKCGFGILSDGQTYPTLNWSIQRRPVVTFEEFDGVGFAVTTTKTGILKLHGENSQYIATGIIDDYEYYGYIGVAADGAVTFTSMYKD